jgi:threonine dehydrogenase-like Zn-dependent dehydrogenase
MVSVGTPRALRWSQSTGTTAVYGRRLARHEKGDAGMGRVVRLDAPRTVTLADYGDAEPGPRQVRLQTVLSGISAGTELTQYRGSNPYFEREWDSERRLFLDVAPAASYPLETWGYQEVGRVDAVGPHVEDARPGDLVYGAWHHRSSTIVDEAWAVQRRLPVQVPPQRAVFARIGAIALNAVLDADIQLGDHVAVFGLGVPGLLATQMARLSGARVIAIDRMTTRLDVAADLGAHQCIDITTDDAAATIRGLTAGRGADVSIELTGSYLALHNAVRATAYNSRVVCSGFLQGEGVGLRLGEEFHHNRIAIVCSQISGIRPDLAHRWSRERMERTVIDLLTREDIDVDALVTHVLPAERAAEAFALLDDRDPAVLQVILDFTDGARR